MIFEPIETHRDKILKKINSFQCELPMELSNGLGHQQCYNHLESIKKTVEKTNSKMNISIQYQRAKSYYQAIIRLT